MNGYSEPAIQNSFESFDANQDQPDICLSLVSEWLLEMMQGEDSGTRWCLRAAMAQLGDDFYSRHAHEQALLSSDETIKDLQAQQLCLNWAQQHPMAIQDCVHEYLALAQARQPVIANLNSGFTGKVMLLRHRQLRVNRSLVNPPVQAVEDEFMRLAERPRFYMLSVKASVRSHVVGIVSTKSAGQWWGSNGYVYYYDPNLKQMLKLTSRNDLIRFIKKTVVGVDYGQLKSIYEVVPA